MSENESPSAAVGDTGVATVESGVAAGSSAAISWLPWIGVVVAAGIAGGTLGATGLLGGLTADAAASGVSVSVPRSVDARVCVDGPVASSLAIGTHVLAVLRSEDSNWAGVRNPASVQATMWVPAAAVIVDEGEPPVTELPVGGACPVIEAATAASPTPPADEPADEPADPADPSPKPAPDPGPKPPPPPSDTTPPKVQQLSVNVNGCPAVFQAVVSDNVGVAQVTLSWSGVTTGSGSMTLIGGTWRYEYDSANAPEGSMTFSAVARDAAGNQSAPAVSNVYMVCVS